MKKCIKLALEKALLFAAAIVIAVSPEAKAQKKPGGSWDD